MGVFTVPDEQRFHCSLRPSRGSTVMAGAAAVDCKAISPYSLREKVVTVEPALCRAEYRTAGRVGALRRKSFCCFGYYREAGNGDSCIREQATSPSLTRAAALTISRRMRNEEFPFF